MGKHVAVVGDVTATGGSSPYSPADSGSWSSTTVTYSSYEQLTCGGKEVIYQAECTFVYSGIISSTGVPVVGEDTVTLTAEETQLQSGKAYVLVDGDCEESSYGNKLEVSANNGAQTA